MFKEEYQKEMKKITPDASFLKDLATKMEAEVSEIESDVQKSRKIYQIFRKKNAAAWATVAAAAVICIGIGFVWQGGKTDTQDENYMTQNAGVAAEQESAGDEGMFAGKSWYGEETDVVKIYDIMLDKMETSKRLVIMKSDSNDFAKAHEISQPKEEELVNKLMGGTLTTDISPDDLAADSVSYYLAEFDDGTIIKFAIYDETYFYCSEFEGIFTL